MSDSDSTSSTCYPSPLILTAYSSRNNCHDSVNRKVKITEMEMHDIQARINGNGWLDDGRSESRRLSRNKINSRLREVVIFMSNRSSIFIEDSRIFGEVSSQIISSSSMCSMTLSPRSHVQATISFVICRRAWRIVQFSPPLCSSIPLCNG
jgi:hypothetical protein